MRGNLQRRPRNLTKVGGIGLKDKGGDITVGSLLVSAQKVKTGLEIIRTQRAGVKDPLCLF